jgi:glutaredoxin
MTERHLVEVLSFEGCPNGDGARRLVERVARELEIEPELRLVDVPDAEEAERRRFLGSPTIRVNGRDIEPGADDRTEFMLACRVYLVGEALVGQPDEEWLRAAFRRGS